MCWCRTAKAATGCAGDEANRSSLRPLTTCACNKPTHSASAWALCWRWCWCSTAKSSTGRPRNQTNGFGMALSTACHEAAHGGRRCLCKPGNTARLLRTWYEYIHTFTMMPISACCEVSNTTTSIGLSSQKQQRHPHHQHHISTLHTINKSHSSSVCCSYQNEKACQQPARPGACVHQRRLPSTG